MDQKTAANKFKFPQNGQVWYTEGSKTAEGTDLAR